MSYDLSIQFGALCKPLSEQIADLGLTISDADELRRIQLIANAVSTVSVHGLMPRSQSDRARQKLFKRLEKIVRADTGRRVVATDDGKVHLKTTGAGR